jgi:hypothetical protein
MMVIVYCESVASLAKVFEDFFFGQYWDIMTWVSLKMVIIALWQWI